MKPATKTGSLVGTGATINVECGFVPTYVKVTQGSGTVAATEAYLTWALPFSGGGTVSILAGATIRGMTSRATATVREVLLASGSFAGGNAAGFLMLDEGSLAGTFVGEKIVVTNLASGQIGTDDADVTAAVTTSSTGAAVVTGTAAISRYEGTTAGATKGFTIGSAIAPAGVLLRFLAIRENT
jgi:hypothetical protein